MGLCAWVERVKVASTSPKGGLGVQKRCARRHDILWTTRPAGQKKAPDPARPAQSLPRESSAQGLRAEDCPYFPKRVLCRQCRLALTPI